MKRLALACFAAASADFRGTVATHADGRLLGRNGLISLVFEALMVV